MALKVLVLGACCAGKSSLCEELRPHHRSVVECDEAVMRAAGGVWPTAADENRRLVVEAATATLARDEVIFLTSWVPTEMLEAARTDGFRVVLLQVPEPELGRRNRVRLAAGGHSDVSHWFGPQLSNYEALLADGLIDVVLDGTRPIPDLAAEVLLLDDH